MNISINFKKIGAFLVAVFFVFINSNQNVLALISAIANNRSLCPAISEDGRYVAFSSTLNNLVPGDTNGAYDTFVYDRDTETFERVNVDSSGNQSVGDVNIGNTPNCTGLSISADGRYVAFGSLADDLVPGDTNGVSDVFVRDRNTNTTERISVSSLGDEGDGASARDVNYSAGASMSSDGRYVVFTSLATNLVPGDTNGVSDVFVRDRNTNTTERISVSSLGDEGDGASYANSTYSSVLSMSSDGRYVVFSSLATNLVPGDTNGASDVFVYDRDDGSIDRLNDNSISASLPSISADGRYVVFQSFDNNTFTVSVNVYDRNTDTIELVSPGSSDVQTGSYSVSISADGRYVSYSSPSNDLIDDSLTYSEIFIYDRDTETTRRASDEFGSEQPYNFYYFSFSGDGRYGVVSSVSTNVAIGSQIFLYDSFNPPVAVSSSPSEIYENQPIGTVVSGSLEVTDIDLFDTHTYTIDCSSAGPDDTSFTVDGDNLKSAEVFDYETKTEYQVCIKVTDNTGLSYEDTVFVYVLDAVPTDITLSPSSIQENKPANTSVGTLTTSNTEVTDTHTYSLACDTPGVDDASFNISTDQLQSSESFDFETKSSYSICVRTTDDVNAATFDKNITVTISDVNEGSITTGGGGPPRVYGCTNSDANNYNPNANQDNGSCLFTPGAIEGCTDSFAGNYSSIATVDDGSCLYGVFGCIDPSATNYNPLAVHSTSGSCTYGPPINPPPPGGTNDVYGCMNSSAINFNPSATISDNSCEFPTTDTSGCTDPTASNYNPNATEEDGSCLFVVNPPTDPNNPINPSNPTGPNNPSGGGGSSSNLVVGFVKENIRIPLVLAIAGLILSAIRPIFSPANVSAIISIPIRIWNIIPTLLGFKRRKRPWGTVYDSVTKQPLDPVYVMLKDSSGKEVGTSITDIDGRYGFQAKFGQYTLFANKGNYTFPSTKLAGKTEDELYNNLYFGENLSVEKDYDIINKNIPMDAINFNWNEFEKSKNKKLMKFYSKWELFLARISKILFFTGLVSSVILAFLEPKTFNFVILGLYGLILLLAFFGIKPRAFGFVTEKGTGYPFSFGILSVFSADLGREVAHTVIGKTGRYYILVPKGKYFIKLRKKTGEDSYEEVYQSESFNANKGYINKIIKV